MAISTQEGRTKVARVVGYLQADDLGFGGTIRTPLGFVDVGASNWRDGGQSLYMAVIVDGYEYRMFQRRTRRDRVTKRGAKILAGRWTRALAARLDAEATP